MKERSYERAIKAGLTWASCPRCGFTRDIRDFTGDTKEFRMWVCKWCAQKAHESGVHRRVRE
jgi:hypothetical protein